MNKTIVKVLFMTLVIVLPLFSSSANAITYDWSQNSAYSYWNGHKVGATSLGEQYDSSVPIYSQPRFQIAVQGAEGSSWMNYPTPGTYTVTVGSITTTTTATAVWIDTNRNGIRDAGEPNGSVNDVYFVEIFKGQDGSGTQFDTLVSWIWTVATSLTGVSLPNPFDLADAGSSGNSQRVKSVYQTGADFGGFRGRVSYYGMQSGIHHVTIRYQSDVVFYIWHEGGTKMESKTSPLSGELAGTTVVTYYKDWEILFIN